MTTQATQLGYSDFIAPTIYKNYKFNQYVVYNHMLIEVGSNGTTTAESISTTPYIAEILDGYLKTIDL